MVTKNFTLNGKLPQVAKDRLGFPVFVRSILNDTKGNQWVVKRIDGEKLLFDPETGETLPLHKATKMTTVVKLLTPKLERVDSSENRYRLKNESGYFVGHLAGMYENEVLKPIEVDTNSRRISCQRIGPNRSDKPAHFTSSSLTPKVVSLFIK